MFLFCSRHSRLVSCSLAIFLDIKHNLYFPSLANDIAIPLPIPAEAPVIIAVGILGWDAMAFHETFESTDLGLETTREKVSYVKNSYHLDFDARRHNGQQS